MKLTLNLGTRSYDIVQKPGVLAKASLLANLKGKVMLVTDDGIPESYVQTLLAQCGQPVVHTLPAGEHTKTPDSVARLQSHLLEEGFGRYDYLATLGGGTVQDVAGFAAASYMGGMPLVHFPTTTASQCGAAIGGFYRLDLDGCKNVLCAPHQPDMVIIDPELLQTLPPRYYAAGLAEALRIGLATSADLLDILEKEDIAQNMERIVYLSLLYKKGLVERDEEGTGEARLLSFGDTIGQSIEAAGGPGEFLHGEAIALGMLPLIETRTLLKRTRAIMRKMGLPLKQPYHPGQLMPYIEKDATREGDALIVTRAKTPGQGYLERITQQELALLLEAP